MNVEIHLTREQIFAVFPAPTLKGTYILASGGACAPVSEPLEQVYQTIYGRPVPKAVGSNKPQSKPSKEGLRNGNEKAR